MRDELRVAEIQHAFFEYHSNFMQPVAGFFHGGRLGEMIREVHAALSPWRLGLENITWNQTAKTVAKVQWTFGIPSLFASIQG